MPIHSLHHDIHSCFCLRPHWYVAKLSLQEKMFTEKKKKKIVTITLAITTEDLSLGNLRNCQGLENLQTVKDLENVVLQDEPTIVFLMETKSDLE